MNNNKLLSIMAITAMCLVSCAVLIDLDESDAMPGDESGGFVDLGAAGSLNYRDIEAQTDETHVITGYATFSFPRLNEAWIALGSYVIFSSEKVESYTTGFGLTESVSPYDGEPVIQGWLTKTGDFSINQTNAADTILHVVDTPFDVDGKVPCVMPALGDGDGDIRDARNDPNVIFNGVEDSFNILNKADFYVALGSTCNIDCSVPDHIDDVVSVTSGFGISKDEDAKAITGTFSKVGTITIVNSFYSKDTLQIHVVDCDTTVDVESIEISGQDSVTVGSQITLTAVTGPVDATDRGVEWSIVSGDGFVSRISTTETATGGTITLQGVSDGVATIRATAADGSGVYKDFQVTVSTPQIVIGSSQGDVSLTTAMSFLYTVQTNVTDCQVLVSGAPWLSVNGNTISGTPMSTGEYDITVTVTKAGYLTATQTFTINVISVLGWSNAPTSGVIVYEI